MTTVTERPSSAANENVVIDLSGYEPFANRKRWTRANCEFLERLGEMPARYELLDGEIIDKVGHNRPHILTVSRIIGWLSSLYGVNRVQGQADIEVAGSDQSSNKPQPDAAVLAKPDYEYVTAPIGSDLLLVIEVSDTTLRDDLTKKAVLYARAGVPEYWVMDVNSRRLIVHRDRSDSGYADIASYSENDTVEPLSSPGSSVRVGDLLPPANFATS